MRQWLNVNTLRCAGKKVWIAVMFLNPCHHEKKDSVTNCFHISIMIQVFLLHHSLLLVWGTTLVLLCCKFFSPFLTRMLLMKSLHLICHINLIFLHLISSISLSVQLALVIFYLCCFETDCLTLQCPTLTSMKQYNPVSYTHLDVYKRQQHNCINEDNFISAMN